MEWGILVIVLIFILVAYIVIQGTRASMAWRRAAAGGALGGRYRLGERGDALPIELEGEAGTPEPHRLGVQSQP